MYALTFYSNIFLPKIIPYFAINDVSKKYTMSFSNTPGPIKPFLYSDSAGNKIKTLQSQSYVNVPGNIGFNLACFSYCNSFKITITADENVFTEVRYLCDLSKTILRMK